MSLSFVVSFRVGSGREVGVGGVRATESGARTFLRRAAPRAGGLERRWEHGDLAGRVLGMTTIVVQQQSLGLGPALGTSCELW